MGMKQILKSIFWSLMSILNPAHLYIINRIPPQEEVSLTLKHVADQFDDSADFVHKIYLHGRLHVMYFSHLVNEDRLERDLLPPILNSDNPLDLLTEQSQYEHVTDSKTYVEGILSGMAAFYYEDQAFMIDVIFPTSRTVAESKRNPSLSDRTKRLPNKPIRICL